MFESWNSYPKIWNIGHPKATTLFQGTVIVEEKLDGCFPGETVVHMADGSKRAIRELVDNRITDPVRCFDLEKKEYTQSPIKNWFSYPQSHKKSVRVVLQGRNSASRSFFRCSTDHLIFTQRGWVPACKLSSADSVLIPDKESFFIMQPIYCVEDVVSTRFFDIETGKHNYLVSDEGVLVHNSQLSFGRFGDQIKIRSKGREFDIDGPDSLFEKAAEVVKMLAPNLHEGWTYRGEYLAKPKHNALAYDRIPNNHIMIFDIATNVDNYLGYAEKKIEANRIGLETVPVYLVGTFDSAIPFMGLLDRISVLGGQKIEGFVVKNYSQFTTDGKPMMGKYVSEQFKEVHGHEWTKDNPKPVDVFGAIIAKYVTEARWHKAVQHMREKGMLENSPRDIGALIKEVREDFSVECADEIKEELWRWFMKKIGANAVTRGIPEWYKMKLLEGAFGEK